MLTHDIPFLDWSFLKVRRSSTSCFHNFLITSPLPLESASQRTLLSSSGHCSVIAATISRNSSCWSKLRVKSNFLYLFKLLLAAARSCLTPVCRSFTALQNQVYWYAIIIPKMTSKYLYVVNSIWVAVLTMDVSIQLSCLARFFHAAFWVSPASYEVTCKAHKRWTTQTLVDAVCSLQHATACSHHFDDARKEG